MLACNILLLYIQASIYVENAESNWILPAELDARGLMFVAQVGLISVNNNATVTGWCTDDMLWWCDSHC